LATAGARPPGAIFGVDEFALEARLEELGVFALGEAVDDHVRVTAAEGMAARAERKALAEFADDGKVLAGTEIGAQGDLVRPLTVDRAFAQFAFAIDQGQPRGGRRGRPRRLEEGAI